MKSLLASLAAVSLLAGTCSTVFAADDPQQEKMKACNAQAGDKKGDERQAFVMMCLQGGPAVPMTPQDKMNQCNTVANTKALKGDDRNAFMSSCMGK